MNSPLIALMLLIGFVLTLHLGMNAQFGALVKNPRMANALFWAVGAATAIIIGLTGWDPAFFTKLKKVPIWLLTAGINRNYWCCIAYCGSSNYHTCQVTN